MKKGFTLVELVIVIIIVGILSIVAVPIYKGYTDRAKETEGKALLGSINTAQKVYLAENNIFYTQTAFTGNQPDLSVDARANKYYTQFKVTTNSQTGEAAVFTATVSPATGTGSNTVNALTMVGKASGQPTITGGTKGGA